MHLLAENHLLSYPLHFHVDDELGADSDLASDRYIATHLLNDLFAYRQTQTCAAFVSALIVLQHAKVHKQFREVVVANSNSRVSYHNLHVKEFLVTEVILLIILALLVCHRIVEMLSYVALFIADDLLSDALYPLLFLLLYSLLFLKDLNHSSH